MVLDQFGTQKGSGTTEVLVRNMGSAKSAVHAQSLSAITNPSGRRLPAVCSRFVKAEDTLLRIVPKEGENPQAISTGDGTYELRTRPLTSELLLRSHGWASAPKPKSLA